MVSNYMLRYIHLHFNNPFGGVNIIQYQLKPVMGQFIFEDYRNNLDLYTNLWKNISE